MSLKRRLTRGCLGGIPTVAVVKTEGRAKRAEDGQSQGYELNYGGQENPGRVVNQRPATLSSFSRPVHKQQSTLKNLAFEGKPLLGKAPDVLPGKKNPVSVGSFC